MITLNDVSYTLETCTHDFRPAAFDAMTQRGEASFLPTPRSTRFLSRSCVLHVAICNNKKTLVKRA
jgi:hypothetical protein